MSDTITKDGQEFEVVWKKPDLQKKDFHYCPGCAHGTLEKLIQEVIDEKELKDKIIGVAPVGCAVFAYDYINCDMQEAAHGRACALATGISRVLPEHAVFTIQGDGDLASIGLAETLHACNRGDNIVIFFYNNAIYGMTGGQMAPTTLDGMKSSTSPYGRDIQTMGSPLKITEMVAQLDGVAFASRQSVHTPGNARKAKKAIRKAFELQGKNKGTTFVEIVSNCNSGWKMTPVASNKWMEENMFPFYPLGDIKVPEE